MTSTLRSTLNELATEFATSVLRAIRGASFQDILSETGDAPAARRGGRAARAAAAPAPAAGKAVKGRKRGRLARRSSTDITSVVDKIVGLLAKHQSGLRAEEIRGKLNLQSKELPRPIAEALAKKRIVKEGQKRATTYFARDAKRAKAAG
jgi:hypothetical protein